MMKIISNPTKERNIYIGQLVDFAMVEKEQKAIPFVIG